MLDNALAWMADHPRRVTVFVVIVAFFVGALENPWIGGGLLP